MAGAPQAIALPVPRASRGLGDQRLVARVASGDDQAFEEIFDRYGPALLSFCTHMLGSREWGEDAVQLTFVAAYEALRRGGCDGALRPWLYAIARNRCLSELRARREIPDSDWVSADRPAIDGPASLFARREQLREVVDDIQRLPADQRAALVLFELGDQSHEEIASVLGVRRDKVKALIFQAREGLYRGRSARESACSEVRERLATARGRAPARGIVRAHIERCAPCQEFEREVRRQRAALALVLPVVLSGKLKALVLSSALSHGSVGAGVAGVTGAGGAGSLSGAAVAGSGSGVVAGPGSLAAGAAASATGSASIAVGVGVGGAGAAAGSGAVSAAVGRAAPTMVASALGTNAVTGMGVGALTSSVSVATVAKLATVVAVAVGIGGVTRSALHSSPRPQVSFLAGQPAPLRSPLQPLVSGIVHPLAGAAAPAGAPPTTAASAPVTSANAAPSSSANPAAVSAPSTPGAGGPASPMGTTSAPAPSAPAASAPATPAPAASAPGDGSATTTAPSSGTSTTTSPSSPTGSGTSTTTPASSPTTTPAGSSSGSSASQGTSGSPSGASGNGPGDSTGQGQPSGGDPGAGATHPNGNGPPITPPGCANNAAPGCAKKKSR